LLLRIKREPGRDEARALPRAALPQIDVAEQTIDRGGDRIGVARRYE
jgi:hypothetical protein